MSRGPGKWQRELLERVSEAGEAGVFVVDRDGTEAEKVAQRRAARTLERAGRVSLGAFKIDGRSSLVAYPPDVAPAGHTVTGLDGKCYRVANYYDNMVTAP